MTVAAGGGPRLRLVSSSPSERVKCPLPTHHVPSSY